MKVSLFAGGFFVFLFSLCISLLAQGAYEWVPCEMDGRVPGKYERWTGLTGERAYFVLTTENKRIMCDSVSTVPYGNGAASYCRKDGEVIYQQFFPFAYTLKCKRMISDSTRTERMNESDKRGIYFDNIKSNDPKSLNRSFLGM